MAAVARTEITPWLAVEVNERGGVWIKMEGATGGDAVYLVPSEVEALKAALSRE